jgi:cholinesterase
MTPAANGKPAFNVMVCGSAETAKARAMYGVPAWRYLHAGARTGSDMALAFGDGVSGQSKIFQSAWGAFIKDPVNGLTKFGWPKYDPKGKESLRF